MNTKDIIQILSQAKPLYDAMYETIVQLTSVQETLTQKETERDKPMNIGNWIVTIILGFFYIIPGVIYYKYCKKSRIQKLDSEISTLRNQFQTLNNSLQQQIELVRQTGIQDILPEQYLNPVDQSVQYILSYLQTGRADSLKEAMNLFEEEKHRINMENMQNEALQQAKANGKMLFYENMINAANTLNNLTK